MSTQYSEWRRFRGVWALVMLVALLVAACAGEDSGTEAGSAGGDDAQTPADAGGQATAEDTAPADDAAPTDEAAPAADAEPTAAEASGEPLKVGVMNPFSGAFAIYGEQLFRGYELAIDEANAAGGVLGRQVELAKGDALTPDQAIPEAQRLATQENVDLFIGTYVSAVSNAASDVANQYDLLYWDTNALASDLTERGLENFIRVGPSAQDFADMASQLVTELTASELGEPVEDLQVYLEHEESIYGTSIAERQEEQISEAGAEVLSVAAHSAGAADLTDSILRARDANPDVWVQTGYVSDTNLLLRTARDQGFDPSAMILVGTGDTFETPEALGAEYLNGIMVVSYPWPPLPEDFGPGSQAFLDAYVEKYGEEPIAAQTMTAFTGMKILLEVIEEAGSAEPAAVREAALAFERPMNTYPNGFGVKFDENLQNTRARPAVIQWQDGERVTVFPPEAAGDNEIIDFSR